MLDLDVVAVEGEAHVLLGELGQRGFASPSPVRIVSRSWKLNVIGGRPGASILRWEPTADWWGRPERVDFTYG